MTEVYAQLAADRDHQARLTAELVLNRSWDEAGAAARKYLAIQKRCDAIVTGTPWLDDRGTASVDT
jgi:hypothetical protein